MGLFLPQQAWQEETCLTCHITCFLLRTLGPFVLEASARFKGKRTGARGGWIVPVRDEWPSHRYRPCRRVVRESEWFLV